MCGGGELRARLPGFQFWLPAVRPGLMVLSFFIYKMGQIMPNLVVRMKCFHVGEALR